jgi:cyclic peptide transporter
MSRLTKEMTCDLELSVLGKLIGANYEHFEKLGANRVHTAMGDINALSTAPRTFVNAFNSLLMVLCCLLYMFWVTWTGGAIVLALMIVLLVVYLVRDKHTTKDLNQLRDLQNDYYAHLNNLLYGFKELKMSTLRSGNLYRDHLEQNRSAARGLGISTASRYLNNELMGSYSWYVVLAVIIFVFPKLFHLGVSVTAPFIVTVLYIMGPVASLIVLFPVYNNIKIALQRLDQFVQYLGDSAEPGAERGRRAAPEAGFESLRFENVTYRYDNGAGEPAFVLGPVNLQISRGEVVFITGGNGSGKSTFTNLLTGLYRPTSGSIYLNGQLVTPDTYPDYRDRISAIFTSNYLFNANYDNFDLTPANEALYRYVHLMQLAEVFRVDQARNAVDNRLSKGQQKRLAMIYALLENKPFLVLDEWAAEQDVKFRAYFYKTFLYKLRDLGKTAVLVTHDDEYYPLAERLIKFDYGKIVSDEQVAASLSVASR